MSLSAAAYQPTRHVYADFLALLPHDAWTEVFRRLDIETLVNMAKAAPELKRLAFSPTILRSVAFDPEADRRTVRMFLRATRKEVDAENLVKEVPVATYVQELRFTNCLVLSSRVILDCMQHCNNLRQLYCVNCVVEPVELFVLLSTKLTSVTKLEWSLHDETHYESMLNVEDIARICTFSKSVGPKLVTMYVEVCVTEKTELLLEQVLPRCGMLRHLHVHAVVKGHPRASSMATCHRVFASSAHAMLERTCGTPNTATFRSSCEQDLSIKLGYRVDEPHELHVWARWLSKGIVLQGFQQATVHLDADPQATSLFAEAADKPEYWSDVTRLTLALMKPTATELSSSPTAHRGYEKPMRRFFRECTSQITELNLSAFHFAMGCNGCDLVASALPNLRALAIPPCAANYADSLESLAVGLRPFGTPRREVQHLQDHRFVLRLLPVSHYYGTVDDFFVGLEDGLPELRMAHVHYVCACEMNRSRSWIRRRRLSDSSEAGVGTSPTAKGLHLYFKPCVGHLCCLDSFIGLVRPRNRM
ncbi:hypothetical protein MTO96_029799 [Rhipicephalus appendiculatus]